MPRPSPTSSPLPSTTGPAPSANAWPPALEPWLGRHLGTSAPNAPLALREEYTRRADPAAAYREAAGITHPDEAVPDPEPHRSNSELEVMCKAVFTALQIRDEADILRGLDRGELEAKPPRRRTRPGQRPEGRKRRHCASPRKPKPTPCSNPPTPKHNTTKPARPALGS